MSVSGLDNKSIHSVNPGGVNNNPFGSVRDKSRGPSFHQTLESQVQELDRAATKVDQALKAKAEAVKPTTLKFSNHAVERMNQRGIVFSPDQIAKIESAARKAAEKGAKETLIFADDSALIVSLKNNTIVTVMDKNMLRENVFTNIDSTVVI